MGMTVIGTRMSFRLVSQLRTRGGKGKREKREKINVRTAGAPRGFRGSFSIALFCILRNLANLTAIGILVGGRKKYASPVVCRSNG
jgi:hypothetical protein